MEWRELCFIRNCNTRCSTCGVEERLWLVADIRGTGRWVCNEIGLGRLNLLALCDFVAGGSLLFLCSTQVRSITCGVSE